MATDPTPLIAMAEEGVQSAIDKLAEAPRVEWPFHWRAFNDLGTERQIGMGAGPIPYSKIVEYAAQSGLDEREQEAFIHVIRTVDIHHMKRESERAQTRLKPSK